MRTPIRQFRPGVISQAEQFARDVCSLFPDAQLRNAQEQVASDEFMQARRWAPALNPSSARDLLGERGKKFGLATRTVVSAEASYPLINANPTGAILTLGRVTLSSARLERTTTHETLTWTEEKLEVGGASDSDGNIVDLNRSIRTEIHEYPEGADLARSTVHEITPVQGAAQSLNQISAMFQQLRLVMQYGQALEAAGVQKFMLHIPR